MAGKGDRAMGYIRVSTVRQVEEGNSIASQTLAVMEYAKSKNVRRQVFFHEIHPMESSQAG